MPEQKVIQRRAVQEAARALGLDPSRTLSVLIDGAVMTVVGYDDQEWQETTVYRIEEDQPPMDPGLAEAIPMPRDATDAQLRQWAAEGDTFSEFELARRAKERR